MDNNNQNEQQDPRTIQPEVIGELRKEKIGKPLIVIELFLLFGIVFAALPMANKALQDEDSQLYKIVETLKGNKVVTTKSASEQYADAAEGQLLNKDTQMKYKDLAIKNVTLGDGQVICSMYSLGNDINLDDKDWYMEILSSSGERVLGSIKLVGTYSNIETNVTLDTYGLNFNPNLTYRGKVVEMTDDDYPELTLTTDKDNIADLVCTKDTRTITYRFQNNYLILIDDVEKVRKTSDESGYMLKLDAARSKATQLGSTIATVDEVNNGFEFKATLQLSADFKLPDGFVDYNYYPFETLAKKVSYAQKSKGFKCNQVKDMNYNDI